MPPSARLRRASGSAFGILHDHGVGAAEDDGQVRGLLARLRDVVADGEAVQLGRLRHAHPLEVAIEPDELVRAPEVGAERVQVHGVVARDVVEAVAGRGHVEQELLLGLRAAVAELVHPGRPVGQPDEARRPLCGTPREQEARGRRGRRERLRRRLPLGRELAGVVLRVVVPGDVAGERADQQQTADGDRHPAPRPDRVDDRHDGDRDEQLLVRELARRAEEDEHEGQRQRRVSAEDGAPASPPRDLRAPRAPGRPAGWRARARGRRRRGSAEPRRGRTRRARTPRRGRRRRARSAPGARAVVARRAISASAGVNAPA